MKIWDARELVSFIWKAMVAGMMVIGALLLVACGGRRGVSHTSNAYTTAEGRTNQQERAPMDDGMVEVVYQITGTAKTVSVTMENATGGTDQGDFLVPFTYRAKFPGSTTFLYISAQIIRPTSGPATISCQILADGQELSKANASGFPSIATCSW